MNQMNHNIQMIIASIGYLRKVNTKERKLIHKKIYLIITYIEREERHELFILDWFHKSQSKKIITWYNQLNLNLYKVNQVE